MGNLDIFKSIYVKLETACTKRDAKELSLYKLGEHYKVPDTCPLYIDNYMNPQSIEGNLFRCKQFVHSYFQYEGKLQTFIGHNAFGGSSGRIGICNISSYPEQMVNINNTKMKSDTAKAVISSKMNNIMDQAYYVTMSALCGKEITGFESEVKSNNEIVKNILVQDKETKDTVELTFINLDNDSSPEQIFIKHNNEMQIELYGQSGESMLMWSNRFLSLFSKLPVNCKSAIKLLPQQYTPR